MNHNELTKTNIKNIIFIHHEKFKELKKMAKPNLLPVLVHARGTGTGMDKKKVDPPYCSKEDILCVANL